MRQVAEEWHVSIDVVTYILRKTKTPRRSKKEASAIAFAQKPMSFSVRRLRTKHAEELEALGAALYWAEGYKTDKAKGVDMANSDPAIIRLFASFLRSRYALDESRLRGQVYCYVNQDARALIRFWSRVSGIPEKQFMKTYVRREFRHDGRKMKYGIMHIRYSDKKLLCDVLNLIESYKCTYASVAE